MKAILNTSAAALVLTVGAAAAAPAYPGLSARESVHAKHVIVLPHRNASVLYDQSAGSNGLGVVSQDFTDSSFPTAYDSQGADDFTVPAGKVWTVTDVIANGGYFNGSGPADSFNVTFYTKALKKGKEVVLASCPAAGYSATNGTGGVDVACSAILKGGRRGKTYYVSVQAVMADGNGGEWGWNTNNNQVGGASKWKNPGGGFATGCATYTQTTTCNPLGEGPDFAFALEGSSN